MYVLIIVQLHTYFKVMFIIVCVDIFSYSIIEISNHFFWQVDGENPNVNMNSKDVIICVLPLFHIYSLNSVLLCGLRVGAAILILQKYDMSSLLRLIQIHKATIAPFVPPIVLDFAKNPDIHNYNLSSIRIVMSGAAPMGKDLEDTVKARLPNAILGQVIYIQL